MEELSRWAPAIVAAIAAVFTYGRYSQKQELQGQRLDEHDELHKDHTAHFTRVDIALVRLEEYNRGFTDASRLKANS